MIDNLRWRSGICAGIEGREIVASHSLAFMDGYDYGLAVRDSLGKIAASELMAPLNTRSNDVRAILIENMDLKKRLDDALGV